MFFFFFWFGERGGKSENFLFSFLSVLSLSLSLEKPQNERKKREKKSKSHLGRPVSHDAVRVARQVRDADVVSPDDEDVGLLGHFWFWFCFARGKKEGVCFFYFFGRERSRVEVL